MTESKIKKNLFYLKLIFIGFLSFILFYWINQLFFSSIIYAFKINSPDSVALSYLAPVYAALSGLAALVVICTYLIIYKLNKLIEKNNKEHH